MRDTLALPFRPLRVRYRYRIADCRAGNKAELSSRLNSPMPVRSLFCRKGGEGEAYIRSLGIEYPARASKR
jgi:hypothetical protein